MDEQLEITTGDDGARPGVLAEIAGEELPRGRRQGGGRKSVPRHEGQEAEVIAPAQGHGAGTGMLLDAGLHELEKGRLRGTLMNAVRAAAEKSKKLGQS